MTFNCNFLKVNAIKNEEASQISKLNDEIKQLKEKLQGQNLYVRNNKNVALILCKVCHSFVYILS